MCLVLYPTYEILRVIYFAELKDFLLLLHNKLSFLHLGSKWGCNVRTLLEISQYLNLLPFTSEVGKGISLHETKKALSPFYNERYFDRKWM